MKKLLLVSLLKAKPKKASPTPQVESVTEVEVKNVINTATKKAAANKPAAKKVTAKKPAAKKATTKKKVNKKD